ncbi:hypothetical protein CsatB_014353 [Cannabis sativa]
MMLSASPSLIVRSSLEEMLDSLRRKDEDEKPKDLPPALPARPTSKGRLPPARRSLPNNFKVKVVVGGSDGDTESPECFPCEIEETKRKENDWGAKRSGFVSKKMKKYRNVESPYAAVLDESKTELTGISDQPSASPTKIRGIDWDDNIGYFMKKKLRVWCRLANGQWESGTIQSNSGEDATVSLSNGNVMKVTASEILPANPDILEGVDDLVQLSYLNEPSTVYNIQHRYSKDMIYSKAGPVLIAVNPFKDVQIYGDDLITAYRQKKLDSPHVYATVDTAYNEMMRDEVSQSIIISGESGAGKTETARIAMQYLAAVSGDSSGIEYRILKANYILEAFGNAITSRNHNSSRFGKLIEIQFSTLGKICGANIQAFFLEKSRVVELVNGERSFHVFYQLCAAAPTDLKERLNLRMASEYKYLNQSDCLTIDGVNEAEKFHDLMKALNSLQICEEDQECLFSMLAAVLWLGNISFQMNENVNQLEVLSDEALINASNLMGCSTQELKLSLSTHKTEAGNNSIANRLTLQQAIDRRDALAKFIYTCLFEWLVEQINKSLQVGKQQIGKSISILDIYGFESSQKNSFEQMCINYANERLQQHLNRHLLKLEQEDYELDGIDWKKVDFEDNEECLELFEKKPSGLISLLDEESNLPKASDLTFANKLKQHLNSNSCFKGERGRAFSVCHNAGEVLYDTNGFLEKNKDRLHSDFSHLLSSCHNELLQLFTSKMQNQSAPTTACHISSSDCPRPSIGTKFKIQMFKLMHQLESTRPHFICCIKPNQKQLPSIYQVDLVLQQLRCCKVLEVLKISRSGYPSRMQLHEFAGRYGVLLPKTFAARDPLSISIAVLQQFGIPAEMYQIGYTKVFLRTGQIEKLEHRRQQVLQGIVGVQKYFRGRQARHHFYELKKQVNPLHSYAPSDLSRGRHNIMVKWRTASAPKTLDELQAVIYLQSVIRGSLVRKQFIGTPELKKSKPESVRYRKNHGRKMSEVKVFAEQQDMQHEKLHSLPSTVKELQQRVIKAEETLEQKEEENAALREQVRQFEARWSDYEAKMKSMEEMWQKQMASLQVSLAAARKSLVVDTAVGQPGRLDAVFSPRYYDSEDATSMGSRTPGASTPLKFSNSVQDVGSGRDANGTLNEVSNLVKEFEQQKQTFDEEAKAIVGIKTGKSASNINSDDDLRKLKLRFEMWKKEYKLRLRETKAKLHKLGHSEAERSRRRWWGRISTKAS